MTELSRINAPSAFAAMIAKDRAFRGIGPAKAAALDARFGSELRAALESRDPAVAELVGDEAAVAAFAAVQAKAAEADVLEWLTGCGALEAVGIPAALKIARCWGHDGLSALQANPYLLTAFLAWPVVDRFAQSLGGAPDDSRRAVAVVEALLYRRLDANHTATWPSYVAQGVEGLIGATGVCAERAIDLAVTQGAVVAFESWLQPSGAAAMEAFLANRLTALSNEAPVVDLLVRPITDSELADAIADYERSLPYRATERQRAAIALAFRFRLSVLAGYAGSGKTTSLRGICEVAERFGRQPVLMALSGRAAQRMSESTGRRAMTIARFLKDFRSERSALTNVSIVVIDEGSMLDLPTLWRIVKALGKASLVLVGDPAQLPPIGFGLTFHVLCEHPGAPKTVLDRVMRQSADSGIPSIAEAIRHGREPTLSAFTGREDGVSFIDCKEDDALDCIREVGLRLRADGMNRDAMQIVAAVKAGPAGITAINTVFHRMRRKLKPTVPLFPGRPDIAESDPVIWTRNDHERGLMNGSMGRVDRIDGGTVHATIDGTSQQLSATDGQFLELAYAISVHKSQGSQWPIIIIPVFQNRLLDRTLLYTAITRASRQVILLGDPHALQKAIVKPSRALERALTLKLRMAEAHNNTTQKQMGSKRWAR
ncbi:exodeoxyribonuclease V alpha subunit [Roseivivax lentus]|uniref:Exodeoxyribonuclease V alpha subunit n=1 Tax=Roseivivax lentus TaxID=633194 RepID=A0A1N7KFC9_9RHOB|nr:AAA family ATPase [Roseivivax lentus]SIS60292.1 exodeoxyribonuclease V alpha subunit [Roseivivax lentus]